MKKAIVIGTLLLPLIAAAADFTPLAVKPGLWEVTMTSKIQLPDAMLANIPPDRRVQMETMMAGRGGQPTVVKSCLTKESLSRALDFSADAKKTCQYKLVTSSASKQEVDVECTANGKTTVGKMTFEALSPESGRATMQMMQDGGTKMNMTMNSKYLGPDCGDVKPR
jgi:glutamate synthase domain-containing protein 2